jgi:coatomer subunit beta
LDSKSLAVLYQCAGTLVSISSSPAAIKGASNTYIQLLLKSNDNNIKLIVLDRLEELQNRYESFFNELSMEILRGLNNSTMEIKKKVLKLSLDSITNKNALNILTSLKKEILSLGEDQKNGSYKQLIVKSIHQLITKFPEISENSLFLLDFIDDNSCCIDVVLLVRDIIESNKDLTSTVLKKLNEEFLNVNSLRVIYFINNRYLEHYYGF